ncbi:MAG: acetoin utilization deacetylase AcuC-like enzyme [Cryomorphaceae bacterium]|jgi:acetoin utilization deacetylase AcuC-like enzyme
MLKVAWNEHYAHELPEGHRFPMEKYNLLPQQLLHEGTIEKENFFDPFEISEERVLRIHTREYLDKLLCKSLTRKEERATGFPLSDKLVKRELIITQGTIEAIDHAFENGVSANIAGGTHHAFRDRGEGFCLLNDIAVGSAYAIEELGLKKILVVDLDVHQGNGTAKIFEKDPRVFTFSVHGEKNYPLRKEASDLDIALPDGTEDKRYLDMLRETLPGLIADVRPELIFFQSGVDVLESDTLGRLSLTLQGCKKRDEVVFMETRKRGIPVVFNMGGGYSKKISVIIEAHANTYRTAREIYF